MLLIYVITLIVWAALLTCLAFSHKSQYVSNRVFNLLIITSTIPIVNTLYLASAIIGIITDKRTEEEREEAFKRACERLDILLEEIISNFKK